MHRVNDNFWHLGAKSDSGLQLGHKCWYSQLKQVSQDKLFITSIIITIAKQTDRGIDFKHVCLVIGSLTSSFVCSQKVQIQLMQNAAVSTDVHNHYLALTTDRQRQTSRQKLKSGQISQNVWKRQPNMYSQTCTLMKLHAVTRGPRPTSGSFLELDVKCPYDRSPPYSKITKS